MAVSKFQRGQIWLLICTDLISRGLDFPEVNLVINYDCPNSEISYIHRIGLRIAFVPLYEQYCTWNVRDTLHSIHYVTYTQYMRSTVESIRVFIYVLHINNFLNKLVSNCNRPNRSGREEWLCHNLFHQSRLEKPSQVRMQCILLFFSYIYNPLGYNMRIYYN